MTGFVLWMLTLEHRLRCDGSHESSTMSSVVDDDLKERSLCSFSSACLTLGFGNGQLRCYCTQAGLSGLRAMSVALKPFRKSHSAV